MKLLITLLFTVCTIATTMAQSMTPLKDALALSPAQHVSSQQIQKESSIQMRGIFKLRSTNPSEYLKERKRIAAEADAKFKEILTAEQYNAYAEIRAEQSARFDAGLKPTALKKKIVIE